MGLCAGHPARAAVEFDYECDVPPNRLSSVDHPFSVVPVEIAGTIAPVISRTGRFSARAGVRVFNAGETMSVGFQLVSVEKMVDDKKVDDGFEVYETHIIGGTRSRKQVGRLPPRGAVQLPFRIAVAPDGTGSFSVGGVTGSVKLQPFTTGKARVLCTAGQFGFKHVVLKQAGE